MVEKEETEEKKVWIACRAKEGCPGTYAEIIMVRNQAGGPGTIGAFNASMGGRFVRYRCLTCGGIFSISS